MIHQNLFFLNSNYIFKTTSIKMGKTQLDKSQLDQTDDWHCNENQHWMPVDFKVIH